MQKHTRCFLSTCLLLLPAGTFAAQISALDTVAGLASEVTVSELTPGADVELAMESPVGTSNRFTLSAGKEGKAHTWIGGNNLQVAGEYRLTVGGRNADGAGTLTVHPDSLDTLASTIDMPTNVLHVGEEIVATVVLIDRFGNALAGRSAELVSSRPDDLVQALMRETDKYGEQQFLVRASAPGAFSLRAVDLISGQALRQAVTLNAGDTRGSVGGPQDARYSDMEPSYTVAQQFYRGNPYSTTLRGNGTRPGVLRAQTGEPPRIDRIKIDIVGQEGNTLPELKQYKAESMLLTALDQYGNRFYDFNGTVYLATTDPDATLPAFGVYTFAFEDEGQKMLTLGLKFQTINGNEPTKQTMVLTENPDEIPSDLSQALGFLVVNVLPYQTSSVTGQKIFITEPKADALLNETEVVVTGTGPSFINITVSDGETRIDGETDRQGNFSVPFSLDPSVVEQTITVADSDAPMNEANVTFAIDVTPPAIQSITFTPELPMEKTDVLVVVQSEPGLKDISITIDEETFPLVTTDATSGKYQLLLTAPEGGMHDVTVSATDALGNTSTKSTTLGVNLRGLPKVQNVVTEAQINAIALRWDPVTDTEIDAYRIYVGTDPNEFLYTLDTDRPAAAATVAGLRPGTTYYFAVTALQDERESEERSTTADATVLGVKLETTPRDGALFVEWNSLQKNIPLSTFLLEYGTDPEQFTEQRILNGDLRAYTLRDLINGVSYYLKLTPVATTGERLDDLAADGQGTPTGAGYTAGTSDPVPHDLRASAPADPLMNPLVQIPLSEEGIPAWMLWTVLGVSGGIFRMYLRHRRQTAVDTAFLQAMQARYHR